jgi:WD40 repeat protein
MILSFDIDPSGKIIALGCSARKISSLQIESFVIFLEIDSLGIIGRVRRLKDPISRVLFSKSGRFLLITTFQEYKGGCVYLYRLEKNKNKFVSVRLLMKDDDYCEDPKAADFSSNGRLVIVGSRSEADLGIIHLYNKCYNLINFKSLPEREDYVIPDVKFSPDGEFFAVAYGLSPHIDVFSANDLSYCYTTAVKKPLIHFSSVSWSRKGDYLHASGNSVIRTSHKAKNGRIFYYDDAAGNSIIRRWSKAGRGKAIDHEILDANDLFINILTNGDIIYCNSKGNIGIVSDQGDILSVLN